MDNQVNLCGVDNLSGWCERCQEMRPATGGGFSCSQLDGQIDLFNDDNEFDHEAYDRL